MPLETRSDAFVIFENGKVELCSRLDATSKGVGVEGRVVAADSHLATLAVVTANPQDKSVLSVYSIKVSVKLLALMF